MSREDWDARIKDHVIFIVRGLKKQTEGQRIRCYNFYKDREEGYAELIRQEPENETYQYRALFYKKLIRVLDHLKEKERAENEQKRKDQAQPY